MNIYTKTGDNGETSLLGKRVKKSCLEIKVLGDVDELNAQIGVLASELKDEGTAKKLKTIQHHLFIIGSNIASLDMEVGTVPELKEKNIIDLENWVDEMEKDLEPLHNFILPGGNTAAAQSFLARAVCRRAEREIVNLTQEHREINPLLQQYLNRLSDLLFVLGRWINKKSEVDDVVWEK